jgi:putative oxidoreductase
MSTSYSDGQSTETRLNGTRKYVELAGRVLLAVLFVLSGLDKLGGGYTGTAAYMASFGVPGALLPLVIVVELGGALAVIVGWKTRIAAFLLAGFTAIAAVIFHSDFSDQIQMIMFLKNVAIVGGLLTLAANGAGPLSIDSRRAE